MYLFYIGYVVKNNNIIHQKFKILHIYIIKDNGI